MGGVLYYLPLKGALILLRGGINLRLQCGDDSRLQTLFFVVLMSKSVKTTTTKNLFHQPVVLSLAIIQRTNYIKLQMMCH